jgi:hypothetical protein
MMQMGQVQQRITQIEQCADDAMSAVRGGNAPDDLKRSVDEMHRKAREAKQMCGTQAGNDESQVVRTVDDLEQAGDRAMQACHRAGNVDPQVQSAVQRAHDEISSLKKQLH